MNFWIADRTAKRAFCGPKKPIFRPERTSERMFARYDICQLEPSDEQTVRANMRSCVLRSRTSVQPL